MKKSHLIKIFTPLFLILFSLKYSGNRLLAGMLFLLFSGIMVSTASASLVTLSAGDTLEIQFDVPALPSSARDFFYIFANGSSTSGSLGSITTELYDGSTLLGVYTEGFQQMTSRWKTASSLTTIGDPQIIDFTTLLDGTIDGLTRTTISGPGSITFDTDAVTGQFATAFSSNTFSIDPNEARILSVTISSVPVPAAVWLFGSGLLGLVGIARRKR